jgi:hypothetical protein
MQINFNDRYGYSFIASSEEDIQEGIDGLKRSLGSEEFMIIDEEHYEVYIEARSDFLTVFVNGLICLDKKSLFDGTRYLLGVSFNELPALMKAFCLSDNEFLLSYDWRENKPLKDERAIPMYLYAYETSMSDLHKAAVKGDLALINLALEKGVDIDAVNSDGHTALHRAALAEKANACELLIEFGANVDLKDNYGDSLLDMLDKGLEFDSDKEIENKIRTLVNKVHSCNAPD